MTTTTTPSPAPLRDVLYQFSLAKDVPDAELLDDFVRRYPEHAKALTDFAIELALDALCPEEPATVPCEAGHLSPAVSTAMSRFQNALFTARAKRPAVTSHAAPEAVPNPFAALSRDAFRALAADIQATGVLLCKLRDRQVQPTTITDGFQRFLAGKMSVPPGILAAHFAAPPQLGMHQHFKADQKPEAGAQQSFDAAVRTSGLTAEQQAFLLSL